MTTALSPKKPTEVTISRAKGRPMLTWVGKKPLGRVSAFPAQLVERYGAEDSAKPLPEGAADWATWPKGLDKGGLLYHGDNKEVLAHLLANGFRGQVKLIYIDPPFDSGADYVRKVQLRGPKGTLKIDGEDYALGEQVQYTDIWSNDNYLQFMYERLLMLKELLSEDGALYLHCDWNRSHHLRMVLDEVFSAEFCRNEIVWKRTSARSDSRFYNHIHDVVLFYTKGDKPILMNNSHRMKRHIPISTSPQKIPMDADMRQRTQHSLAFGMAQAVLLGGVSTQEAKATIGK